MFGDDNLLLLFCLSEGGNSIDIEQFPFSSIYCVSLMLFNVIEQLQCVLEFYFMTGHQVLFYVIPKMSAFFFSKLISPFPKILLLNF